MSRQHGLLFTTTGRASRYVISVLIAAPGCPAIRVITRSAPNILDSFPAKLREPPHSIVVADHYEGATFAGAFEGIDYVFHDGLPVHPLEEGMGMSVIDTAKAAGVRHFIMLSVLQPVRIKLPTHKVKLGLEEYLVESRLNYTILQPPHFMQNVDLELALRTRKIPLGYSSDHAQGFVDLVDIAAVVRKILQDPDDHNLARYELVSQNISYKDIAKLVSEAARREIKCDDMTPAEYLATMNSERNIRNEYTEDIVLRILLYYDRWGLVGNSNTLRWLLGREPNSWQSYLKREIRR
ncbi:hypothetical protein M422DRAFT_29092 [Sphaerobolus stellatus SS14]|uniref:NmrA-like domain-containing protein n=1 Tax=Sphaerobolus stellatus (strain SS14) TaxID=990650 RepID=A0A0C9UV15_SPHS4|nr:hypothetical protein M422DRAFT_29092 [Sphaerobolus stellatus SS14]